MSGLMRLRELTDVSAAVAATRSRKAKTEAKRSMRTDVARAVVHADPERVDALRAAARDLADAGRIADLSIEPGDGTVDVELAPAE